MTTFWAYFLPLLVAGLLFGIVTGSIASRLPKGRSMEDLDADAPALLEYKRRRSRTLIGGAVAAILAAALWHGPFGAADRFAAQVQSDIRLSVTSWEMPQVTGQLHHGPLTRRVLLSGRADNFQRGELARIIETVPGVSRAGWTDRGGGVPLIAEGVAAALVGFLFGLLLAYLFELRRRYNAQWSW